MKIIVIKKKLTIEVGLVILKISKSYAWRIGIAKMQNVQRDRGRNMYKKCFMNGYYSLGEVQNMQGLRGWQVNNIEDVRMAQVLANSGVWYFPSHSERRIYTKCMEWGVGYRLDTYEPVPLSIQANEQTIMQRVDQIMQAIGPLLEGQTPQERNEYRRFIMELVRKALELEIEFDRLSNCTREKIKKDMREISMLGEALGIFSYLNQSC